DALPISDPFHNAVRSPVSLHKGRIEDKLYIGISPGSNIDDITYRRSGWRGHDTDSPHILRYGLLVLGSEHPHLGELLFQRFELLVQKPRAVEHDLSGIELIPAVSLIDADAPQHDHLLSFLHTKRKPRPGACEHNAGNRAGLIFQ